MSKEKQTRVVMLILALVLILNLFSKNIANAQPGVYAGGSAQWIEGNGKIYTSSGKVGIGTNSPLRKLHIKGAGHQYIRATSTGSTLYHTYVAGLELRRILDNGTSLNWDIVNQGGLKIRRNTSTLFHLEYGEAQLGTQNIKNTFNIWGKHIINAGGGSLDEGSLAIRNYISGQYQTLRLDGNQLESSTEFHINFLSDEDVHLVHGGGNVNLNTNDNEAKLNVDGDGFQLKLMNNVKAWKIGVSNDDWQVGEGKLVFTRGSSSESTMVLTEQGRVGIGMTTPSKTLDVNGTARAKIVEITGGSDFAESFEINEKVLPGSVVSIDTENPGKLKVANKAFDKTVAGIISGAGNINPGMIMGQEGSIADGEYPVALTGRVYCLVDASYGAIEPGDLLTTSNTAGHAMKVRKNAHAQGAIIGKAMTSLKGGKGLVLVLVSLQ